MEPNNTSFQDLAQAFSSTELEPEIDEAVLLAFADGTATEAEREMVETMMEVDPTLAEAIAAMREELNRIQEPLPAVEVNPPKARLAVSFGRLVPAFGLAIAACLVLLLIVVRRAGDLESNLVRSRRDADTLRSEVATLQERGRLMSHVSRALAQGLQVPAFVGDLGTTREEVQLDLKMKPSQTVIRQPVVLAWSGDGAEKGADVDIEVSSAGIPVWHGHSSHGTLEVSPSVLKGGTTYSWRVVRGPKVSDWSSFGVCTPEQAKQAAEIESDPEFTPLDRGILFAQMGLVSDAEREFQSLRSSDRNLADRLIRELHRPSR